MLRIMNRILPNLGVVLALVVVLFPYWISFGDERMSFSLHNKTQHYLHAIINGESYVYIAPSASVLYQSSSGSVNAEVSYSPGQGITGSKTRSFTVTWRASESTTCANSHRHGSTCESSTSASADPLTWEVVPSDLVPN